MQGGGWTGGEVAADYDNEPAGRRAMALVGLLAACAATILATGLLTTTVNRQSLSVGTLFAILVAASDQWQVRARVGRTDISFAPLGSAAVVAGTAFMTPGWLALVAATGVTAVGVLNRRPVLNITFNVSKATLAAAAAALGANWTGVPLVLLAPAPLTRQAASLAVAAVGYALVDEVLSATWSALTSQISLRNRMLLQLDIAPLGQLTGLVIAFLGVWGYQSQPWLIAALPLVISTLHLASSSQLHRHLEREAWQRLATMTDGLSTNDLEKILVTAVRQTAEIFHADQVELLLQLPDVPDRLIRGTEAGIVYDGSPAGAQVLEGYVIRPRLDAYPARQIGNIRLYFFKPVRFTEREAYTLRTLATALNTALRTATTAETSRQLAADHLRSAYLDPLTQLANRARLIQYGADLFEAAPNRTDLTLLLIDLNRFKEINENLGLAAGDQLLIEVGQRLRSAAGPEDLVVRSGGDEFAVLFSHQAWLADPAAQAQRVLAGLDTPVKLDGISIQIEASGGVATTPVCGGLEELLRQADIAMYQAKRTGKRIATYLHTQDLADMKALALHAELARGLEEEQFVLEYQPIVDLESGVVISAEALVRWDHPERGRLAPGHFLDGVERSGLLAAFSESVLVQALTAAGQWQDAGFPLDIAVNVSPRSLLDPGFPEKLNAVLARHKLGPERLILELTESVTLSQLKVVDQVLNVLRTSGIRLALDDFGTGYSSLSMVTRVPVYELKIDRSFVASMDTPAAGAIVRSTIELAKSLRLLVVAEGVETEQQRQQLRELGCSAGQGYLFARPMSADRLLDRLRRDGTGA